MKNSLVLVIGGTSGIGLSTAQYLSDKGYQVIACGRRRTDSGNIVFEHVDVVNEDAIIHLRDKISNRYGAIYGLVYSAGITFPKRSIEQFETSDWLSLLNVNVTGLFLSLKYFFQDLKATQGRVVVINSLASRTYSQFSSVEYTASKSALSGIVRQLASDWVKEGVLVNSVHPSMTKTQMLEKTLSFDEIEAIQASLPLNKWADMKDTARAVEYLLSPDNRYTTGCGIDVSAGQYLSA